MVVFLLRRRPPSDRGGALGHRAGFPWYYYDSSDPLISGVSWGNSGILIGALTFIGVGAGAGFGWRHTPKTTFPLLMASQRLSSQERCFGFGLKERHRGQFRRLNRLRPRSCNVAVGPKYWKLILSGRGCPPENPPCLASARLPPMWRAAIPAMNAAIAINSTIDANHGRRPTCARAWLLMVPPCVRFTALHRNPRLAPLSSGEGR